MIRAFATAIAVSVARVVDVVFDVMLASRGYIARELSVISIWISWIGTLAFGLYLYVIVHDIRAHYAEKQKPE